MSATRVSAPVQPSAACSRSEKSDDSRQRALNVCPMARSSNMKGFVARRVYGLGGSRERHGRRNYQ